MTKLQGWFTIFVLVSCFVLLALLGLDTMGLERFGLFLLVWSPIWGIPAGLLVWSVYIIIKEIHNPKLPDVKAQIVKVKRIRSKQGSFKF